MLEDRATSTDERGTVAPSSTPTAASGSAVERHYVGSDAEIDGSSSVIIAGDQGVAGDVDPMLTEPIDFDVELADRALTYEPLEVVDGDLTNDAFGI
jgi:hypothetical protein